MAKVLVVNSSGAIKKREPKSIYRDERQLNGHEPESQQNIQRELRRGAIDVLPWEQHKYQFLPNINIIIPCIEFGEGEVYKLYKLFRTIIHSMRHKIKYSDRECDEELNDINKKYGLMYNILKELKTAAEKYCKLDPADSKEGPKLFFSENIECVKFIAHTMYIENKFFAATYIREIQLSKMPANELLGYITALYNIYYEECASKKKTMTALKEYIIQVLMHNYCTLNKFAIYNIDNYIKLLEIEAFKQWTRNIPANLNEVMINNAQYHESLIKMFRSTRGTSPIIGKSSLYD
jgi:hypothetical protein